MSGPFHAAVFSRPRCLDVTARYEDRILLNERLWDSAPGRWPLVPVFIATVALLASAGLLWWRHAELSAKARHRSAMIAFARHHPAAAAFVPRLRASPLKEHGALALALVAFAAGLVASVDLWRSLATRRFYVGEGPGCRVPVDASLLPDGKWPLISPTAQGFELRIAPGMDGEMWLGSERYDWPACAESSLAKPIAGVQGGFVVHVPAASRFLVKIGPVVVTVEDPLEEEA